MLSTGRCLCGAICYTLNGATIGVLDCHCSRCRRESGASSLVFAGYQRTDVTISGSLKYYRSSDTARRGFCSNCGSPVCYEDDKGEFIWLTVGTHDDAGSLPVREHVYVADKVPWVEISKDLRQWPGERGQP
jgi:hypothetical protein